MSGELAEMLDAAEADGVRNLEEILTEDALVDASTEKMGPGEHKVAQRVGEVHELGFPYRAAPPQRRTGRLSLCICFFFSFFIFSNFFSNFFTFFFMFFHSHQSPPFPPLPRALSPGLSLNIAFSFKCFFILRHDSG